MERHLKFLINLYFLAVVGFGQSSGARFLRSDIFLRNSSILYPYLNGRADLFFSAHKSSVPSYETLKMWSDKTKESPQAEETLSVAAQGSVTPGNAMVDMQQLATSDHSPGVGHMQIYGSIHKSPPLNSWKRRQQKRVSRKRILQSTPSPGNGH